MEDSIILLKNCFYVATFNDSMDELSGSDILIKGNRIEKIEESIELTPPEKGRVEIIDCSKYLVMPGMINTHHHLFQNLTRNLPAIQGVKLFDWLTSLYPIWACIDEEAIYYSTLLGCGELLKTGATTTTDHHYIYPENFKGDLLGIQFDAASKLGIRFSPSRGSMTMSKKNGGLPPDELSQSTEEVLKDSQRVIEEFHDSSPLSMRRITLAPCSPFSAGGDLMKETASLARAYNVTLHTHLAESLSEEEYCQERFGKRPLELMEELNWVGEGVSFAHGIHFNDSELDLLRETKTSISHCPTSNMRLGSGIARVCEMLGLGITVGLGVDGSSSNDSSDMLGEVRNAMLLQRVKYGPSGLSAREALELAIKGGAKILNFTALGSIEVGKGADIAMFDINCLQYAGGLSDPLACVVFAGFNHETAYTIVNGKIVVREGKLVNFDEGEIVENVNRISARIIAQINL
ncbi:MAG: 8-oxoguanine deaminase [Candidatus Stahlbacteria bacterium]|nr:MAG: 8-oxoguanine deaminase [Candidatus Stahlbacteria bacterium]